MSIETSAHVEELKKGVEVVITSKEITVGSSVGEIISAKREERFESRFRENITGLIGAGLTFVGLLEVIHGMSVNDGDSVEGVRNVLLGLFMVSYSAEVGKSVKILDREIVAIEAIRLKKTDIPA